MTASAVILPMTPVDRLPPIDQLPLTPGVTLFLERFVEAKIDRLTFRARCGLPSSSPGLDDVIEALVSDRLEPALRGLRAAGCYEAAAYVLRRVRQHTAAEKIPHRTGPHPFQHARPGEPKGVLKSLPKDLPKDTLPNDLGALGVDTVLTVPARQMLAELSADLMTAHSWVVAKAGRRPGPCPDIARYAVIDDIAASLASGSANPAFAGLQTAGYLDHAGRLAALQLGISLT